ncbi:hypothetical protein WKW79_03765 [Variovorax robiniae]|uniref:MxaK protein n=1 Tax=Variovorax robiniae TaxID=1836199 RepID=A0ABU8X1I2_9BURK
MGLNKLRRRTRVVWGLLAVLAVAAMVDGALAWRKHRWNEVIASGTLPADTKEAPPELRFAQAHAQAEAGEEEAALHLYRSLEDETPLGQSARYNSANLLIRQAVAMQAGAEPGKAIPLIELAKEIYRDVLRVEPDRWDARYNLERAQRLLPDPDELEPEPPDLKRNAERAATTMRGFSPGLP